MCKHKEQKNSELLLEICNGKQCVYVKLLQLPQCPRFWHFKAVTKNVQDVSVTLGLSPKLQIEWPGTDLVSFHDDKNILFPTYVNIGLFEAYKIKDILHSPFCTYLYIKHQNKLIDLKVCEANCQCESKENAATASH